MAEIATKTDINSKIMSTYSYYFQIIDIMLSDMSEVTINDIKDVIEELGDEIEKIRGAKKDEISAY